MKRIIAFIAIALVVGLFWFTSESQVLQNVSGTTTLGGSPITGLGMTNNNGNSFVIFTNNGVSISMTASGVLIITNYAAAGLGFSLNTNGITQSEKFHGGIGTAAAPAIASAASPSIGFYNLNGDWVWTRDGSSANVRMGAGRLACVTEFGIGASASAPDVLLSRTAAGSATFSTNLTARGSFILPTNYVAANFTPVAGHVKIASSNGVLYSVTQTSTNLITADVP